MSDAERKSANGAGPDPDAGPDVKVVDRRWWARDPADDAQEASVSLKPTYVEELERQLAERDQQLQTTLAKYRAAAAEFEDARLRLRREVGKDVERVRRQVIAELLEVLDNLDRSIEAAGERPALEALLAGVVMIRDQFLAKLEGLGVKRLAALGEPFDPTHHEAVTTVPSPDPAQNGQIVGVIRHGYSVGTDVLRPAAVAVIRSSADADASS